MSIRACPGRLDRNAVLTQNLHCRATNRFAGLDRNEEDLATAICMFFRQYPNVGDEKKSTVSDRRDRFPGQRVPTASCQEKQTTLASSIRRFAQVGREIERRIIRFPF